MIELGVTLDPLALVRESHKAQEPDPVMAAVQKPVTELSNVKAYPPMVVDA